MQPEVGDYRIGHMPDSESNYLIEQFAIDGVWEYKQAMKPLDALDFIVDKAYLGNDATYDYWR